MLDQDVVGVVIVMTFFMGMIVLGAIIDGVVSWWKRQR